MTWRLPTDVPHIGLIADKSHNGRYLVVHNIGAGARIEDILFSYEITGHYRYDPPGPWEPGEKSTPPGLPRR